jgi:hypothetical protein
MDEVKKLQEENAALAKRLETAEAKQKDLEGAQANQIESLKHLQVGSRSDSLESQAMRIFGCSDAKQLLTVNTESSEFRAIPPAIKGIVRELKKSVDVARFMGQIFNGEGLDRFSGKEGQDAIVPVKSILSHRFGRDVAPGGVRPGARGALDSPGRAGARMGQEG